jgi:signal transduction histidine kinase
MEHVLSGNIDHDGVFHGQVKAYGEWRKTGSEYVIYPPKDYTPPKGPTTIVGPVGLHVATFEQEQISTTLSSELFSKFEALTEQHSGFLIFRNGLRVLPYGRLDNDFFEIEERRSRNAGREFWNKRRMFGRVAISRELNPNLRDKAGREGFIDNRSAKALRILIINILKTVSREYFGSSSELRKELLPDIRLKNKKERADEARKDLAKINAKKFRANLQKNLPRLTQLYEEVKEFSAGLEIVDEGAIQSVQDRINAANNALNELRLTYAPARLGSSEDDYRLFRRLYVGAQEHLAVATEKRTEAVERINPTKPHEIAERQLQSLASRLHARLNAWRKSIDKIQTDEQKRISLLFEKRGRAFHDVARPLLEEVRLGRKQLSPVLDHMAQLQSKLDEENEDIFQSYIEMLELMSENINIELIARQGTLDNSELKDDLNKLNQVAQLGVTVEILGHELSTSERMIREGLRQIKATGEIAGTALVETGFEAISRQLEFLAPLKVSGSQTRRFITGKEIGEYLKDFFEAAFKYRHIDLSFTEDFASFGVDEQPSRLLPVFVNLVNNSIYWLVHSRADNPKILLSVVGGRIIVSDNGPGIDPVDQESLFKMFFTRKVSGGRGIGLYLCRVNLMAGGHSIEYATNRKDKPLGGANFVMDFRGASFG